MVEHRPVQTGGHARANVLLFANACRFSMRILAGIAGVLVVGEAGAQQSADHEWVFSAHQVRCLDVPDPEKEKFGCGFVQPQGAGPSDLEDSRLRWAWLTEIKLVTCDGMPAREIEKFDRCSQGPSEAEQIVLRLKSTREQLSVRADALQARQDKLDNLRLSLATPEQMAELEQLELRLQELSRKREELALVEALRSAAETAERPDAQLVGEGAVAFARMRADAFVFPATEPEARSIARLTEGTLVLRIGDEIENARRLIFAPDINFGYVSASMVLDNADE